mmetsp:Transcript_30797/g.95283  ORF Transcript_30797/g.95283 Transcript_30797/m.95283 type:complete len:211 (-) Transcript_30797:1483-2115(-)
MRSPVWAVALVVASLGRETCAMSQLTVKILAQKRVEPLNRLLVSLQTASYPPTANIDLEVHVDHIPADYLWPRRAKMDMKRRQNVLELVNTFVRAWKHGNAKVVRVKTWQGIRGMWLACTDPGIFGEEFTHVVILEDDVELSPAWYISVKDQSTCHVYLHVGSSISQRRTVRTREIRVSPEFLSSAKQLAWMPTQKSSKASGPILAGTSR